MLAAAAAGGKGADQTFDCSDVPIRYQRTHEKPSEATLTKTVDAPVPETSPASNEGSQGAPSEARRNSGLPPEGDPARNAAMITTERRDGGARSMAFKLLDRKLLLGGLSTPVLSNTVPSLALLI